MGKQRQQAPRALHWQWAEAEKPSLRGLSGVWPSLDLWTAEFSQPAQSSIFPSLVMVSQADGHAGEEQQVCLGHREKEGQMSWGRAELHRGPNGQTGTGRLAGKGLGL